MFSLNITAPSSYYYRFIDITSLFLIYSLFLCLDYNILKFLLLVLFLQYCLNNILYYYYLKIYQNPIAFANTAKFVL